MGYSLGYFSKIGTFLNGHNSKNNLSESAQTLIINNNNLVVIVLHLLKESPVPFPSLFLEMNQLWINGLQST